VNLTQIAKRSFRTLWTRKHLWFFGFFVAAAGSSGGGGAESGGAAGGGAIPAWILPLAIGLGLLGLVAAVLHVLSEAALIRGVRDDQNGEVLSILDGLRESRRHFWSVLAIKALLAVGFIALGVVIVAPIALGAFEVIPMLFAALLALPLVVVATPAALSMYFLYEYALRFVVLDEMHARDGLRASRRFLHGRLGDAIRLTLLSFVGQVGGSFATFVACLPAAVVGLALYFTAGLVPAAVAGGLLALPAIVLVRGATGTFRSSVWTLGFMEGRA
jgi:hypothetical protein